MDKDNVPTLSHTQLKMMKEKRDKVVEERYADKCKKRLTNIVSKKINTSFIGAVAQIEDYFGFLWGIDVPESEKTEEQRKMYEIWQALRSEILTNGNNQLRAAKNEISQYKVIWNRYKTELKISDTLGQPDSWTGKQRKETEDE